MEPWQMHNEKIKRNVAMGIGKTKCDLRGSGLAVALAWPGTYCKQTGAWYEPITRLLGFNRAGYYQAGHAAVLLIDLHSKTCEYFDFGRYHAPFGQGRVRSGHTDPDLRMNTQPVIEGDRVANLPELLHELAGKAACHGSGDLHASLVRINFHSAYRKAMDMQMAGTLPYGPFIVPGTNCSRFVRSVLLSGKPGLLQTLRLLLPFTITPSPMTNVRALSRSLKVPGQVWSSDLPGLVADDVLPEPNRPEWLPDDACWMAGEGAGSWFQVIQNGSDYHVSRIEKDGTQVFNNRYQLAANANPDLKAPFKICQGSHVQQIDIRQQGILFSLKRLQQSPLRSPTVEQRKAHGQVI